MKSVFVSIVHLAKFYPPHRGGMEEACEGLAESARGAGHTVRVECFVEGPATNESRAGLSVHRHSTVATIASQPFSWSYFKAAWNALGETAVVQIHAPNMLAALAVALRPRIRARLLVHWHSDVVGKGWLKLITLPIERAMLRRANRVVATSPPYALASAALARTRQKLQVIPLGIRDLPPSNNGNTPRNQRLVLAVGRLVPYKGFDVLIEAAAFLPSNVRIVIAGGGPLLSQLQHSIDSLGVSDRVQLAGRVSENELATLYTQAALFCLPSVERSEAFGVVLLEAMRAGLPIVASDIPGSGVPWVNQNGETGYNVPVGDASSLAHACLLLLDNPELRRRMGRAARGRFEKHFVASTTAEPWLATYRELAEGVSTPGK